MGAGWEQQLPLSIQAPSWVSCDWEGHFTTVRQERNLRGEDFLDTTAQFSHWFAIVSSLFFHHHYSCNNVLVFYLSCTHRLSQSLTRTETASSAKMTLGTCWPQWVRLCFVSVVYFVNTFMNLCWTSSSLSVGQLNVKNEELEAMIKEASGPINFTVFLTMFGEKLKGMQKSLLFCPSSLWIFSHSVSVIRSLCLWKVLTPKTSLCLPSRCWIQRAPAPSRSNCESIFTDILFPCGKKKKKKINVSISDCYSFSFIPALRSFWPLSATGSLQRRWD